MADKKDNDQQLKEMFEAAHADPHLKKRLLDNPEKVAKEFNVSLGKREIARLRSVGVFANMANEAINGRIFQCDPRVCYPATHWFKLEIGKLLKEYVIAFPPKEIFYPAPIFHKLDERLDTVLRLRK